MLAAALEQWTWEQVCILLRNPSLIAAELERQQQDKLVRLFRGADEEQCPVDLIQRELAQIEKENAHLAAALTQIEAQLAAWQVSIER